jgi:hypothetical protein
MRNERIVGTCEGERKENVMFYNLIIHRELTMFFYVLGNTTDAL